MLIIAFRIGRRAPTRRYSYGYRRAEDLVGLGIGLVIALSAAVIIWESVNALTDPQPLTHLGWVLTAAVVGAAGNEAVAVYRIRAGRRIGSAALVAEGQHARTDALTSLAVVIGVAGAWMGLPQLDAVVGDPRLVGEHGEAHVVVLRGQHRLREAVGGGAAADHDDVLGGLRGEGGARHGDLRELAGGWGVAPTLGRRDCPAVAPPFRSLFASLTGAPAPCERALTGAKRPRSTTVIRPA